MKILLFLAIIFLALPCIAQGATEFVSVIDPGGSAEADFSSLSSWESIMTNTETDLTAPGTLVFSGTVTTSIANNTAVYQCRSGSYQGVSGTMVYDTVAGQALVKSITGGASFTVGDRWYEASDCTGDYFQITNTGDSAIAIAKCRTTTGAADTAVVTIDGFTTSATNYIKVWTDPSENYRHPGYVMATPDYYHLRTNSSGVHSVTVNDLNVLIDGLEIKQSSTGNSDEIIRVDEENVTLTVKNSLLYFGSRIEEQDIIYINSRSGCTINLENVIGWNAYRAVVDLYSTGQESLTVNINSCSFYNIGYSASDGSRSGIIGTFITSGLDVTANIFNSLLHINTGYVVNSAGGTNFHTINIDRSITNVSDFHNSWFYENLTDNLLSQNWTDDKNKSSDGDWVIFNDIIEEQYDFRLTPNAYNEAQDFHSDSSGAGLDMPSDDIVGTLRPSDKPYDAGAFEIVTKIYRSVAPEADGNLTALANGADNHLNISGSTATFDSAPGETIGVGDALEYDDDNDGDIDANDSIVYIHGRTDSTHYTIKTSTGGVPTAPSAADEIHWNINRAYTSLSNAEGGIENENIDSDLRNFDSGNRDIVTNGEQWNIACYANGTTADTTAVQINGWTTGPANYIRVYTPTAITEVGTSQRHSGKWDDGKYRLEVASGIALSAMEEYIRIDGLQLYSGNDRSYSAVKWDGGGGENQFSNNVVNASGVNTWDGAVVVPHFEAPMVFKAWNNVIFDAPTNALAFYMVESNITAYLYNNTIQNCSYGIVNTSAQVTAKNNILQVNYKAAEGNFAAGTGYNATNNDSLGYTVTAGAVGDRVSQTFSFVDEANDDFHLANFDVGARNYGTNLSSDTYIPFMDDIDGELLIRQLNI